MEILWHFVSPKKWEPCFLFAVLSRHVDKKSPLRSQEPIFCLQLAIKKLTVPTVSVQCMTCMEVNNFVIPSYPIKFIGYCGNCESGSSPRYKWTVFDDSGDELVLNITSTSTGNTFVPLFNAVRKGVLSGSNRINIIHCVPFVTSLLKS